MNVAIRRRRFSVEEYYRMAETGIFHEDDRVELIDGEIVEMTPIGTRHAACVGKLGQLFWERVGKRAIVRIQNPLRLSDDTEPQPDVTLLRPRADFYASKHPCPNDALLIVEVADVSLPYDRDFKAARYAQSGIPEYWVVDLEGEQVHAFRDPKGGVYGSHETLRRGEGLRVRSLDVGELSVDDVLV